MASVLLLIPGGVLLYFAAIAATVGVGAIGDGAVCVVFLFLASLAGGAAALLLVASHACHGWRDARRRTGIVVVVASANLLVGTLFFGILPLEPSIWAILLRADPALAAIPWWRMVLAAIVPVAAVASGVWLLWGEDAGYAPPAAGFGSTRVEP